MAEELEVIIGANTKGIEEGATRAERALSDVQKSIKRLEKDIADNITISRGYKSAIDDLTRAYKSGLIPQSQYSQDLKRLQRDEKETQIETKRLTAELNNLKREQKQLNSVTPNLVKNTNQAGKASRRNNAAWVEFGRVIGDSAYGIQGVANNLQQLAFLIGGGAGLSIAVSAITTLLVVFDDEIMNLFNSTDALIQKTKEYYNEVRNEVRALNQLIEIANNENNSKKSRLEALKQINDNYSDYLGNLDLESLKTDAVRESVDKLTKSLIRQAKIKGLEDTIAEKTKDSSEKLIELDLAREKSLKVIRSEIRKLSGQSDILGRLIDTSDLETIEGINRQLRSLTEAANQQGDIGDYVRKSTVGLRIATNEYDSLTNEIKETNEEANNLIKPFVDLQTKLKTLNFGQNKPSEQEVIITADLSDIKARQERAAKEAKALAEKERKIRLKLNEDIKKMQEENIDTRLAEESQFIRDLEKIYGDLRTPDMSGFNDDLDGTYNKIQKFEDAVKRLQAVLGEGFTGTGFSLDGLVELENRLKSTQEFANVFSSSVASSFSQLGSIAQEQLSKSGKAVQILGGILINTATQIISQLIQNAIQQAIIGKLVQKTEKSKASAKGVTIATNAAAAAGPLGFAALPGLLAGTQAMIQGAFAATEGFNFGGFVGDRNLVRMNGNERVLTATEANTFNNLMLNRNVQTQENKVYVEVGGTFVQRGNDLVATVRRTNNRNNRRG